MTPIISIKDVGKKYRIGTIEPYGSLRDSIAQMLNPRARKKPLNEFWALQDISFDIAKGDSLGVIGRNGAGKSTLLKILSQITPPTTGKISMRGRVASLLEVGTGFNPELTGRENIFLNGAILGMTRLEIKRKFDEIVAFSGIAKFLDTPVKRYSSGMYVRLAFSVAAHLEPEILIVDEVLSVGDAEFQKKCLGKMDDVTKKEGRTVLFVSHNLVTVQNLCKNTLLLENGQIKHIGTTKEVIHTYLNATSAPIVKTQLNLRPNVGEVRFTDVQVLNNNGSGLLKSDDKLRILVKYSSDFHQPIAGVRVIISIFSDATGQIVLRLDSAVTAHTLDKVIAPHGEILCETGEINLVEGLYWIGLDIVVNEANLDHLERCSSFNVESNLEKYNYKIKPDKDACDWVVKYSFKQ